MGRQLSDAALLDTEKSRILSERPEFLQKLVINPEWRVVQIFTMIIIIFSICSALLACLLACFGAPKEGGFV